MPPTRYSHPAADGRPPVQIRDHLRDVAEIGATVTPDEVGAAEHELPDIVARCAWAHDFGKLTTWFQRHIGMLDGRVQNTEYKNHARLSACLAYYALQESGFDDPVPLAGFVAVAKHHQALPDTVGYVFDRTLETSTVGEREVLVEQVTDIDDHVPELAADIVAETTDDGSWSAFAAQIRDGTLFEAIGDVVSKPTAVPIADAKALDESFYQLVIQLWSTLVFADKTAAAGTPRAAITRRNPPATETLETYIEGLGDEDGGTMADLRREARADVLGNLDVLVDGDANRATLTLPTGAGKTLTGVNAACRLRDALDKSRIVYALPFTSIIDQVSSELPTAFADTDEDWEMVVHHHLAETEVDLDVDGWDSDRLAELEAMLGQSWRADVVVTTFVQLFESLAGPKNRQSMKLPALYDSVVILDEVQSLPHRWWKLVRRLIDLLTDEYDATVIAMTATQPKLFEGEAPELVSTPGRYYQTLDRVRYRLHRSAREFCGGDSEPLDYTEAAESLTQSAATDESVLAVCNTIGSARALTRSLDDVTDTLSVGEVYESLLGDEEGAVPAAARVVEAVSHRRDDELVALHLTTRLRPRDRATLLEVATGLIARAVPLVTVSTQLIEAGVDVSFDGLYRDFAPLDSLVQAGGRCNRSLEQDAGEVTVWWLTQPDEGPQSPAEAVYETGPLGSNTDSLLSLTGQALDSVRDDGQWTLSEPQLTWTGVDDYYDRLRGRNPGDPSLVEAMDRGEAATLGAASLIDQEYAVDVLVVRTGGEHGQVQKIRRKIDAAEFDEARRLVEESRDQWVSVPVYTPDSAAADSLADLPDLHEYADVKVLDARGRHEPYFDETEGIVVQEDAVEARFL